MYKTPNHQFHPLLAELDAAMEEASNLHAQLDRYAQWIPQTQREIEPSAWTARIEAALDKPSELQLLKARRDEALLSYESSLFAYYATRDRLMKVRDRIFKALGPLF